MYILKIFFIKNNLFPELQQNTYKHPSTSYHTTPGPKFHADARVPDPDPGHLTPAASIMQL